MEHVAEVSENFEFGGHVYTVNFIRITRTFVDPNYGADADGRRGERRVFIDEDSCEGLEVNGKKIADYPKDIQDEITSLVEDWMRENKPDLN